MYRDFYHCDDRYSYNEEYDEEYNEEYNEEYGEEYDEDEDVIIYQRYFLVDYENVNKDGLNGVAKLTDEDYVQIYYSEDADTMTFGLHRRINESEATFDYFKVQESLKNAVDCRMIFELKELIKENRDAEFYIVSKDHDFDETIRNLQKRKIQVKKIGEICKFDADDVTETKKEGNVKRRKTNKIGRKEKKEAQIRSYFGRYLKEYSSEKEEIISILLNATSKNQVNNEFLKLYRDGNVSSQLYHKISRFIEELPGK